MLNKITSNPKLLFLIDGVGALLSAFLLGVVLASAETTFGMPRKTLYFLAALACLFALYSFWNHVRFNENWRPQLRGIAIANLLYCGLTAAFVIYFRQELTKWGLTYFLLEMVVVLCLVAIEFKTLFNPHNLKRKRGEKP
jgi:peptidoglycan/LPS O-acetylase OafA/YrhL